MCHHDHRYSGCQHQTADCLNVSARRESDFGVDTHGVDKADRNVRKPRYQQSYERGQTMGVEEATELLLG